MNYSSIFAWVGSVIVVIVLIALEICLSKRKNRFVGWLPILLVFSIATGLAGYTLSIENRYHEETESYALGNDIRAEITIEKDEAGNVIDYSHLYIRNGDNVLIDVIPMSASESKHRRYGDVVEYYMEKFNLQGDSVSIETVEKKQAKFGESYISAKSFLLSGVIVNIPLLLLLAVNRYILLKQRRTAELKKINIEMFLE